MSIAYPLRNRFRTGVTLAMFTLVVFTLVCGAITTASFVNGVNNLRHVRRRLRRPRDDVAGEPDRRHARRARPAPGFDPADFRVVSSQSLAADQGPPGRHGRQGRALPRPRRSTRVPRPHDVWPRGPRARLRLRRRGLARARASIPASPSWTRRSPRAGRTSTSARVEVPAPGLLPRGQARSRPSRSTSAIRRPAGTCG